MTEVEVDNVAEGETLAAPFAVVGCSDFLPDGDSLGNLVGFFVGTKVGLFVGARVG